MNEALALIAACALDAAIGDPRWLPHPVVLMGRLISIIEKKLAPAFKGQIIAGVVLAAIVTLTALALAYAIEKALMGLLGGRLSLIAMALYVYLISTCIACHGLITSVRGVLSTEGLQEARKRLSMLVGRETGELERQEVDRAALETLSENASDGVIAPLFYFAIGGLPLAMFYKAVNTLDSMVGYKNDKYRELGWASARLDDIMNFIPARLTGILISAAALFIKNASAKDAMRIMRRDRLNHTSPNAGVPEAAMAGALGLRFGGPSMYGGRLVEKPYIGDGPPKANAAVPAMAALWLIALASVMGMGLAAAMAIARAALW